MAENMEQMITFDQASAFFAENPGLHLEFVLNHLNSSQKLELLTSLKEVVPKKPALSLGSFDSKDDIQMIYRRNKHPSRFIMVDPMVGKKSRSISRVTMPISQYRRMTGDLSSHSLRTKTESYKSMGVFVNPRNLPSMMEGSYDEIIESPISSKTQNMLKKQKEPGALCGSLSSTSKRPDFLHNLRLEEEDPLAGYSFENVRPDELATGIRLASSLARSELSALTSSKLPKVTVKKRSSLHSKEGKAVPEVDKFPHLPDVMRDLIERIIKHQYSQHDIIRTSTTILTEHAGVDVFHLHLRGQDEVSLIKSTCSSWYEVPHSLTPLLQHFSQFSYQFPAQRRTFCTPFTAAFWTGKMIVANFVMMDVRWDRDKLFYDSETKHSIAYPLFSINGNVFAVIELLRLMGRPAFEESTVKLIHSTLQAMQTIMLLREKVSVEHSITAYSILSKKMAGIMLAQIRELDAVMNTIMTYAKQMVQAEKCSLFLVDVEKQELVSSIVDRGNLQDTRFENVEPIAVSLHIGVFGHVVHTGECVVTNHPQSEENFYQHVGVFKEDFQVTNMITVPIKMKNEVVGVLQLLNKASGDFDINDVENIKDFSVFCGLTLHIAKMYEKMFRSEQKCRITMEIMLHHNLASDSDVMEYSTRKIPDSIEGITHPLFSPWHMPIEEMPAVFIYMVYSVTGKALIDLHTLIRFTLTVRKNYRDVIYHNWYHAFSVAHGIYAQISRDDSSFTLVEKLCLLIAALCHDLDHRGTDNSYQRRKGTPLATLYSTSILEHHHFNMTLTILQQPGNQVFARVTGISYYEALLDQAYCGDQLKYTSLVFDQFLRFYPGIHRLEASKKVVMDILDERGAIDWEDKEERMATVAITLPVADLCSMYKPWEVHKKVVLLVMEEMWAQGDEEKRNGFVPIDLMNRDLYHHLPEMQSNFYKAVCLPLFRLIARVVPSLMDIPDQAFSNFSQWTEMCLLPESVKHERVKELIQRRSRKTTAHFTPV